MVGLSRLAGGGLVLVLALTLLPLALDGKPAPPPQALHKASPTAPAALRILWDLHPDSKRSRAARDRMVHSQPHVEGGGDSPPLQDETNKQQHSSCFGQKIDRINAVSGMGCGRVTDPPPPPPTAPAALRIIRDSRPDSKQSRATRDQVVQPEPHAGGGSGGDSRPLQDKGPPDGCFGLKLDRIGAMSGLGCNGASKPAPKPTPGCGL